MAFLVSTVPGCVSVFAFVSLVTIPIGITGFGVEIIIFAITAGIKKYKSIIKKKKKKHDKKVFLAKSKLNTVEVIISKALTDSYFSNDEFFAVNSLLKNMKWKKK